MTTPNHPTGQPSTAWQRHHATTEAAMHAYLTTTHAAHRAYLTGPWPDRDSYNAVELSAWMTYHAKCRASWNTYHAEITAPPPPPLPSPPDANAHPVSEDSYQSAAYQRAQPTFTPGDVGHGPDQFDQRQETYPAADPNRRDQP